MKYLQTYFKGKLIGESKIYDYDGREAIIESDLRVFIDNLINCNHNKDIAYKIVKKEGNEEK